MATKENKRQVKELVEGLEQRVQCGPAIRDAEIQSARDFLRQHDFSPASDYFNRLAHVENRLQGRAREISQPRTKCNYGGKAGGYQMQVQSIFDHVILPRVMRAISTTNMAGSKFRIGSTRKAGLISSN